jgi:hypothetical protein
MHNEMTQRVITQQQSISYNKLCKLIWREIVKMHNIKDTRTSQHREWQSTAISLCVCVFVGESAS